MLSRSLSLVLLLGVSVSAHAVSPKLQKLAAKPTVAKQEASSEELFLELQEVAAENIDGFDSETIAAPLTADLPCSNIPAAALEAAIAAAAIQTPEEIMERDKRLARVVVMISKRSQTMRVFEDGQEHLYPIATEGPQVPSADDQDDNVGRAFIKISTGTVGHDTPVGYFRPIPGRLYERYFSKTYNNAPMHHAVFFNGGIALHQTVRSNYAQLGTRASHGCVRQTLEDAIRTFNLIRSTAVRERVLPTLNRFTGALDSTTLSAGYDTVIIVRRSFPGEA